MNARSPSAFMLSAFLHGAVAALLFLFNIAANRSDNAQKVFEVVAGEGENYLATEAPALGTPGGVKVDMPQPLPQPPTPQPPAPEPVRPQPQPVQVAPTPPPKTEPKVTPKAEEKIPDFSKQIKQEVRSAKKKAEREIKKERDAEQKRVAEEQKKAEEQKRLTKEEFDRTNKSKTPQVASAKSPNVKAPKIDAEGIAKGVVGGSPNNKVGGAGGKALTATHDNVLDAYYGMFKQRLRDRFEPPPNASDTLRVVIEMRSEADGSLSGVRVIKSSGNKEFDDAVLDAVRRVRMPARPDGKSETVSFPFNLRERDEG